MIIKPKLASQLVLLLGLTAILSVDVWAADKVYKLRYAHVAPPRGANSEALMWWADELHNRSDGQIEVEFFWSQSLVKGKEIIKAVGSGIADVGFIMGIYIPADLPIWNAANAPFNGDDRWVGARTWQELHRTSPELQAETARKNVKILAAFTPGPMDILSKKPILTTEDLRGTKIRTTGGWSTLMKNLGATPVRLGIGETYQALDKGALDATINYTLVVDAYKHYEVAGHVTQVKMGMPLGLGTGINLKLFNSMPEHLQKILLEVSDQYVDINAQYNHRAELERIDAMKSGVDGFKVEFHSLSELERQKWEQASRFFLKDWTERVSKKGVDGHAFIQNINSIYQKYQKELDTNGYPWER